MKIVKNIFLTLLVVFVAMQFYRPEKNTSQGHHTAKFIEETNPSQDVKLILENSCYDCHSGNTRYPWYNDVAPISYLLAKHIKNGKGNLNFSEWESYSAKKKAHKLEEVIEVLEEDEMPMKSYILMHEEAKLTDDQKKSIIDWSKSSRLLYQLDQQPQ